MHFTRVQHVMSCMLCLMATRAGGPLHWGVCLCSVAPRGSFQYTVPGNFFLLRFGVKCAFWLKIALIVKKEFIGTTFPVVVCS